MNQRWRNHRTCYRPEGELINPALYDVATIDGDHQARAFIEAHHYSKSYPAARFRFGLYEKGALVGVAVFSHPCHDRVLTSVFPFPAIMSVELGRFALLDTVPGNGESWFLARCFEKLRSESLEGVVSFSDPLPRKAADGRIVHRGHVGTIYQAFNGVYLGLSAKRSLRLLPDGTVLSDRAIQKIRRQERGWRYASGILQDFGALPLRGDPVAWLSHWLPKLTTRVRHPGNHKYAWPLSRLARKVLPASLAYPKQLPLLYQAMVAWDPRCFPA